MSSAPRIRACRFSSVTSAGRPANGSTSTPSNAVITGAMGRVWVGDTQGVGQIAGIDETALARERRGHQHARHVVAPQRFDGDHRRESRVDPPRQPEQRTGESALARVVAHAEDERGEDLRLTGFLPGTTAETCAPVSTTSVSSANAAARPTHVPSGAKARLRPSKIKSSLAPTWLA